MPRTERPAFTQIDNALPRRRAWHKTAMHWIRRLHLYAGLFMFPWVLLYGITAFLFNHPGAFPDQQVIPFGRVEIQGTALQSFPRPGELARKVVAALEHKAAKPSQTGPYQLVEPDQAAYRGDFVFARIIANEQEHIVRVNVADGTGRISARRASQPAENGPFTQRDFRVDGSPADTVRDSLPTVLERLGLPAGEVTVTFAPKLSFLMEAGGKRWHVTCDTQSGEITGRPAEAATSDLTIRSFLLRLHLAHGFPTSANAHWFWAIVVDAMFIVMVFWALSGLLMFWQIKAIRRWGIVVLLISAVVATALIFAMHNELTR